MVPKFNEEVLKEERILVKFGAPWCGPCKQLDPIIEDLHKEGISVYSVNTDEDFDSTVKYQVRSVPTVIAFHNGSEISRHSGVTSKTNLISMYKGENE